MKRQIKILGTGCTKCKTVTSVVTEVVRDHQIDAEIEKVEDIVEIMKYDVLATPAVVIDGQVVITGRVPGKEEVLVFLN